MKVAIVGGGQLARMMALSGISMGINFSFLIREHESERCIKGLGTTVKIRDKPNFESLYQELACPDVVTVEHEHVSIELLEGLSSFCHVYPGIKAIRSLGNRVFEKNLLMKLSIPTSKYFPFFSYEDLKDNIAMLDFPVVIKTSFGAYDGKGQYIIKNHEDLAFIEEDIINHGHADKGFIAEEFVNFRRELSFLAVRSSNKEISFYPTAENTHKQSILFSSIAPAKDVSEEIINEAHKNLRKIMEELDYVGVLAMECFHLKTQEGEYLLVNELAPRVHNSGHWTQSGCMTDQFENHLRAILGLTLGATEAYAYTGMLNILGKEIDPAQLGSSTSFYWYNKEVKDNRKMGHINIVRQDYESLENEIENVMRIC